MSATTETRGERHPPRKMRNLDRPSFRTRAQEGAFAGPARGGRRSHREAGEADAARAGHATAAGEARTRRASSARSSRKETARRATRRTTYTATPTAIDAHIPARTRVA